MTKTLLVAGYGPGISHAVAQRFGKEGFQLALVARTAGKLAEGVKVLEKEGLKATAFPADLTDLNAVRGVVQKARTSLGPITVLHWNVAVLLAGDLLTARVDDLLNVYKGGVAGLVAAIQEALTDMRHRPESAVLVTNGGLGALVDAVDAAAVQSQNMGLAVANAAKHKAARVLAKRLEAEGVFLGEVTVAGTVKGTPWDKGQGTLEAKDVAERFWRLYEKRGEHFDLIKG